MGLGEWYLWNAGNAAVRSALFEPVVPEAGEVNWQRGGI
jgi:hypothetical protein